MEELTAAEFNNAIAKGNAVIDFWAPWCGPCQMMAPAFEAAAKGAAGVKFAKVNVDENPEVAQQYGVRGIPTVVFFKDGKEVNRFVGALGKPQIDAKVKETFG
jgi:thioredoxin